MPIDADETASQVERKKRRFRFWKKSSKKTTPSSSSVAKSSKVGSKKRAGTTVAKTPGRQVALGKDGLPMSPHTMAGASGQESLLHPANTNGTIGNGKTVGFSQDGRNGKATGAYKTSVIPKESDKQLKDGKGSSSSNKKKSWLSGSKYFQQMADSAFDAIDADGSGEVDEKELYSGLLLIHLKLGSMAGPAACKPVDRDRVHHIFEKYDADDSGALDRQEFHEVMTVLTSNVVTRVLVQWSLTLLIVPMLAKAILDGIVNAWMYGYDRFTELDNIEEIEEQIGYLAGNATEYLETTVQPWLIRTTPPVVAKYAQQAWDIIDDLPETVWNTVPVTILSAILSVLVVPYSIYKIDQFFDWLAERNKTKKDPVAGSDEKNRAHI